MLEDFIGWLHGFFLSFTDADPRIRPRIHLRPNPGAGRLSSMDSGDGRFRASGHRLTDFLTRRWEATQDTHRAPADRAGGVWLVDGLALFDLDLRARLVTGEPEECVVVEVCNCGFYARLFEGIPRCESKTVDVAVRYEADFENTGRLWADHPHHHLQWDPIAWSGVVDGARQARTRTEPMLPSHFFEFCIRHFRPALWESRFREQARALNAIVDTINEEPEASRRRQLVRELSPEARDLTDQIRRACEPPDAIRWCWAIEPAATNLPL